MLLTPPHGSNTWFVDRIARYSGDAIRPEHELVVPTIVLVEVGRWLIRANQPEVSAEVLATGLASFAADLGVRHKLPLADSIVFATAIATDSDLWTQDGDFGALPRVHFHAKQKR